MHTVLHNVNYNQNVTKTWLKCRKKHWKTLQQLAGCFQTTMGSKMKKLKLPKLVFVLQINSGFIRQAHEASRKQLQNNVAIVAPGHCCSSRCELLRSWVKKASEGIMKASSAMTGILGNDRHSDATKISANIIAIPVCVGCPNWLWSCASLTRGPRSGGSQTALCKLRQVSQAARVRETGKPPNVPQNCLNMSECRLGINHTLHHLEKRELQ